MSLNSHSQTPVSFISVLSSVNVSKSLLTAWVFSVLVGQWFFATYIAAQFGKPFMTGDSSGENFAHMIKGHVAGDTIGNVVLLVHILPVFLLSLSGIFQLIPRVRIRYPRFHRWNGRTFLAIGLIGAFTGLWLTWVRGARLSDIGGLGITLNGLLIPIAIALAWHYARKRNFQAHKRWAIHAFILINGVWSFRLMLMGWFLVNQGPNGNNATLDGPADITMSFACYLLPMFIAEVYFWAERSREQYRAIVLNLVLFGAVAITLLGVAGASMFMWLPKISAAFA